MVRDREEMEEEGEKERLLSPEVRKALEITIKEMESELKSSTNGLSFLQYILKNGIFDDTPTSTGPSSDGKT